MPVIRSNDEKPDWLGWSDFGFGTLSSGSTLEPHFHDAHEFWAVFQGRARVRSEGKEYVIGPGDVLVTQMGDEHEIVEVLEAPFKTFWVEQELTGRKRPGHLHSPADD